MSSSDKFLCHILVVVRDTDSIQEAMEYYGVDEPWSEYNFEYQHGEVYIVRASTMKEQICGIMVHAVRFWEGSYYADEINYALTRVRL